MMRMVRGGGGGVCVERNGRAGGARVRGRYIYTTNAERKMNAGRLSGKGRNGSVGEEEGGRRGRKAVVVAASVGRGGGGEKNAAVKGGGLRRTPAVEIDPAAIKSRVRAVAESAPLEGADLLERAVKPKDGLDYAPPPSVAGVLEDATYAIVEVGGTQLIVQEGRHYVVNHLKVPPGTKIELNRVYALKHGASGKFFIGKPVTSKVTVEALVLQTVRAPKITVFKFKRKKHYKKTQGHRQLMSRFVITKIEKEFTDEEKAELAEAEARKNADRAARAAEAAARVVVEEEEEAKEETAAEPEPEAEPEVVDDAQEEESSDAASDGSDAE